MFAIVATCVTHSAFAQIKIIPIDESPGRPMAAGVFASADQTLVGKYMPSGSAPTSMSSFVLFAGEEAILFDAALGGETWVKKLTDAGVKPENVKLILLTHMHGDHIGGLLQGNDRRFPQAKVLSATPEYEHWLPKEGEVRNQQIAKIKSAYGQDFEKTFKFDEVVFENSEVRVKALDASGHTPGHTVFLIESVGTSGDKLLILGDLLHAVALQFPVPEACARFDMDTEKAVAARKRILDFAAQEKIPVTGMHFPAPYIGKVEKNDQGGYIFRTGQ